MEALTGENMAQLADPGQPLSSSKLAELSNLDSTDLKLVEQVWAQTATKRRRQIVHRLAELVEDNLELNFDSIFKLCLKDPDEEVRRQAIEGLWENEEASLIGTLIDLLKQDSSETIQAQAAIALGKFAMLGEENKLRSCHTARLYQALLATLDDKNRPINVRCRALEAAAPLSLPEIESAIEKAYQSNHPQLKTSAIYAMGKNCSPYWLPILLKEMSSPDAETRYEAAGACGELEDEIAVPHLIILTADPDSKVQMAAIGALGNIGGSESKVGLEQCRSDPNTAIQQAAEEALHQIELETDSLPF
ncbi:HEAT repeat domain-containing protein [Chloroflexota bacterium]